MERAELQTADKLFLFFIDLTASVFSFMEIQMPSASKVGFHYVRVRQPQIRKAVPIKGWVFKSTDKSSFFFSCESFIWTSIFLLFMKHHLALCLNKIFEKNFGVIFPCRSSLETTGCCFTALYHTSTMMKPAHRATVGIIAEATKRLKKIMTEKRVAK